MFQKAILSTAVIILIVGVQKSSAIPPTPILLTINDSDPTAVTITATGLNSGLDDSGRTANDGVDLLGFFTQDEAALFGEFLPNSTLTGGNTGLSFNDVAGDNYSTGGGDFPRQDLELYVDVATPGSSNPETFSTTQPAFSGTWTLNLSALGVDSSALPAAGSQGQILSGYSFHPGQVIGTWQVEAVPEPTAASLLLLGLPLGWIFLRRRTAKA